MAVDLGSTLQNAQDSNIRQPLVELRSVQAASTIPFVGNALNYSTEDEYYPALITHSTGVLVAVWYRNNGIRLSYSDADHITWVESEIIDLGASTIQTLDITELTNGNIGIVYSQRVIASEVLKYAIVTMTGTVVTSPTVIDTYNADFDIIGIAIETLNNNTYYMTYSLLDRTLGIDYGVYRRSSSNFTSWGAETEITTGFTSSYTHYETEIFQTTTDNDLLLFVSYAEDSVNGSEIVNIYQFISTDYGATWGASTKITSFSAHGRGAFQPSAAENSAGQVLLAYSDQTSAATMDTDSDLWQQECGDFAIGARLSYDESTGYLYSINTYTYSGIKKLCSIVVIDTRTWVVHRSYTTTTTPAYPSVFTTNNNLWDSAIHEGKYISASIDFHTIVVDDAAETIKHYVWKDNEGYTRNITGLDFRGYDSFGFEVAATHLVAAQDRLYVTLADSYIAHPRILVGYIDLTETAVAGFYTWTEVKWVEDWEEEQVYQLSTLLILPEDNKFILSSWTTVSNWKGRTEIYTLDTGSSIKEYSYDTDVGYPYNGVKDIAHHNGIVYGYFNYNSGYGQENYRGMVRIDLVTEAITYLQPNYASQDDYYLQNKYITSEGLILISAHSDGLVTYDIPTGMWTQYTADTAPELALGYPVIRITSVAYNETDDIIYAGNPGSPLVNSFAGIRAFTAGGTLKGIDYRQGEKSGSWSWGTEAALVSGNYEQDPSPAYLSDDTLWAFWQRTNSSTQEKSIYYDNTVAELDLTPYLTEDGVTVTKSVKSPGKLSFSVSKGHLFDPNNSSSTLNRYLKKGRAITLRFGELINGTEYWSTQGTFYVDTFKLSYARGEYPKASITCVDRVSLLKWAHTIASTHFDSQYPEAVIESLLLTHTNLEAADIDIGTFDTRHTINYQIVDEKLLDAIGEILDHFGYFLYASVDNQVEARPVRFSGVPDNILADNTKLIDFTPDDNFSDYTNRVTVMGEGLNPVEVLYDEEVLATYAGTGGWWETGSEQRDIYYSEDKKKKARNARLSVNKSIKDFEILWQESEGTEYLLSEDPSGYFCTIVIEFPGLMWVLIGLIASLVALGAQAIFCDYSNICGIMLFLFSIVLSGVSYLLGQVATYDYEIYARPYGEEKQQYQASVDDLELQNFLNGLVIEQTIEDPFCYTQAECLRVATYEMHVLQAQRNRVSFNKIANIQDEPGDILRMNHPYSGTSLDVFVTDISRTYKRGTVRKKQGFFIDKINGWRL